MTTYAYDPTASTLLATWSSGIGATARPVARLHTRTGDRAGMHLAQALTDLSTTAWLSYTAPGSVEVRAEPALQALRRPHLPAGELLRREPDPVLERAHGVGRALAGIGSAGVRRAVAADLTDEFDAVRRAGHGDLSGRARQAVRLTRLDPHPVQVAAADRLLHEIPMGGERLFDEVDPTAASVAAVHWMLAAVDVTLRQSGGDDPVHVLGPAADAEGHDLIGAEAVLALLRGGHSPLEVVQNLVGSAVLAAGGMILRGDPEPDPAYQDTDAESRYTLLNPLHPSRALLSDLTRTVQICFTVFAEHVDPADVGGAGSWNDLVRDRFDDAVRAEAARTAERLGAGR